MLARTVSPLGSRFRLVAGGACPAPTAQQKNNALSPALPRKFQTCAGRQNHFTPSARRNQGCRSYPAPIEYNKSVMKHHINRYKSVIGEPMERYVLQDLLKRKNFPDRLIGLALEAQGKII